jgi:transcription elongation factor GreA
MENVMTKEGLEALREELERLETTGRHEIAEQIKVAREFGDLKENAEYHAAKEAQGFLEARIVQMRAQLENATIVEAAKGGDVVAFGTTVELEDESTGRKLTYTLVSAREQAPAEGKLSFESPVGSALRDKRVGDVASIATPKGERRLRVVSIS